jgi:hypothetical protein
MRKVLAVLTVAALASVALAACGGDDDDSSGAKSTAKSDTTEKAGSSDSNGSDTTDVTTGNKKYDELIAKAKTTPYRVTYKSTGSSDEFTIVNDPPKSAFITGDSRYVRDGDKTTVCSGTGGDAQCYEMPAGGAGVESLVTGFFGAYASFLAADEGKDNPFLDVSNTDDETIAGRDAACAKIEAAKLAGAEGSIKVCIDKETGVLLLGETESNGQTNSIEATDVGEPKDSDFEVPDNATQLSLPSDSSQ